MDVHPTGPTHEHDEPGAGRELEHRSVVRCAPLGPEDRARSDQSAMDVWLNVKLASGTQFELPGGTTQVFDPWAGCTGDRYSHEPSSPLVPAGEPKATIARLAVREDLNLMRSLSCARVGPSVLTWRSGSPSDMIRTERPTAAKRANAVRHHERPSSESDTAGDEGGRALSLSV